MEYDFRKRTGSSYESNVPSYGRPPSAAASSAAPVYGQQQPSLYPKIGSSGAHSAAAHVRNPPFHHATLPPQLLGSELELLSNQNIELLRQNVLTEAIKENPNWSRLGVENVLPKATEPTQSYGPSADPIISKYIAAGLNREAVPLAVANYGDNHTKVKEFSKGFTLLREMGFSSNNVAEALLMYENDTDKAIAHFLSNAS